LCLYILARRFVFYLLSMMLNDASGGSPHYGVMARDMADHTAYGGAFQATLRISHRGQQREGHGKRKAGSQLTHFVSPSCTDSLNTRQALKIAPRQPSLLDPV
jgi:hypothetical protein